MVDFASLKKARSSSLEDLNSKIASIQNKDSSRKDDRFWNPTVDEAGNAYVVFRFLPAPENEDEPFIRIWDHGFQGPGGWYIENSLTSIGLDTDPVGKMNSELWQSGIEANKDIARKQKRRLHFISNIYIEKDSGNPANNGKTFLYKYGKTIFDKVTDAMNPKFEDEKPVNPFDFWEGASFRLKIQLKDGYRNYDKSDFGTPGILGGFDDEKLEEIWKSEYSLQAFLDPSNFKSPEDLQKRLNKVLGISTETPAMVKENTVAREEKSTSTPSFKSEEVPFGEDDDDADLDFFKRLVD